MPPSAAKEVAPEAALTTPNRRVFDDVKGRGGSRSDNPEPPVLDDARVAAKAAPTKTTSFFL